MPRMAPRSVVEPGPRLTAPGCFCLKVQTPNMQPPEGGQEGGRWKQLGWMRVMLGREATSTLNLSLLPMAARLPILAGGEGGHGDLDGRERLDGGRVPKREGD